LKSCATVAGPAAAALTAPTAVGRCGVESALALVT
jgi:hypothetical protein